MKTLLLLRHAKASRDDLRLSDIDRPLTGRGRRAAALMGRVLAERKLVPDLVLCSTARRARETYDGLAPALGSVPEVRFEQGLYLAEPPELLRHVKMVPDSIGTVLLIGHNPGLERFAVRLAGSAAGDSLERIRAKYPTGALAVLRFDVSSWQDVAPSSGRLDDFVAPRDLDGD